jgi:transcriptional regulator with XRE-family HTH domain
VHGPALRHIRQLTGLSTAQLADEVGITPDYLRKIELGFAKAVAPNIYAGLIEALRIDDRRVLLPDPWRPEEPDLESPADESAPSSELEPGSGGPGPAAQPAGELKRGRVQDRVQDRVAAQAREVARRDEIDFGRAAS